MKVFDRQGAKVRLDDISAEPPKGMTREKAEERFATLGQELFDLQDAMFGSKVNSVMVVLQGRDSAGKDGAIKHVVGCLNPRGVIVTSFGVPTPEEREHDFLWRVHRHAPRLGEFSIFNRSHYEDVLVVRTNKLFPEPVWRRRYEHIRGFERMLADEGTTILKFYLHIDRDEQRKRLQARLDEPDKNWKFDAHDLEQRKLWDDYMAAYADAIRETSRPFAPWYIVPANRKWYRDYAVMSIIVDAMRRLDPRYPEPDYDPKKIRFK